MRDLTIPEAAFRRAFATVRRRYDPAFKEMANIDAGRSKRRPLARLLCFLLGHVFDELVVHNEQGQPRVYIGSGVCDRCGKRVFEIPDQDTVDEITPTKPR